MNFFDRICKGGCFKNASAPQDIACEQALCFGGKIARKGKGRGGESRRQTFEAAIPPSCNYPADHLSVRSLSVNQFGAWVTPGKINGKWVVFCSIWKQSEMEREPHCRFCKKSLICGKRINTVPVAGSWEVVGTKRNGPARRRHARFACPLRYLRKEKAFPI